MTQTVDGAFVSCECVMCGRDPGMVAPRVVSVEHKTVLLSPVLPLRALGRAQPADARVSQAQFGGGGGRSSTLLPIAQAPTTMAPPATTPVNTVDNTDNITPWNTSHATLPAFALDIGRRVKRNHNQRTLCETGTVLDHNKTIVISENHLLISSAALMSSRPRTLPTSLPKRNRRVCSRRCAIGS